MDPICDDKPFHLFGRADGVNWLSAPLAGSEYSSMMALNGSLALIKTSAGWQTITIG